MLPQQFPLSLALVVLRGDIKSGSYYSLISCFHYLLTDNNESQLTSRNLHSLGNLTGTPHHSRRCVESGAQICPTLGMAPLHLPSPTPGGWASSLGFFRSRSRLCRFHLRQGFGGQASPLDSFSPGRAYSPPRLLSLLSRSGLQPSSPFGFSFSPGRGGAAPRLFAFSPSRGGAAPRLLTFVFEAVLLDQDGFAEQRRAEESLNRQNDVDRFPVARHRQHEALGV